MTEVRTAWAVEYVDSNGNRQREDFPTHGHRLEFVTKGLNAGTIRNTLGFSDPGPTKVEGRHCQQCGSTDPEDLETYDDPDYQGYTRCCNERNVDQCDPSDCSHA